MEIKGLQSRAVKTELSEKTGSINEKRDLEKAELEQIIFKKDKKATWLEVLVSVNVS